MGGCGGFVAAAREEAAAQAAEERAAAEAEFWAQPPFHAALEDWLRARVSTLCDGQPSGDGWHVAELHGVRVRQRCGLLANDVDRVIEGCQHLGENACSTVTAEQFSARAHERYPRADWAWVNNHCSGYPAECDTFERFELLVWRSQDEADTRRFKARVGAAVAAAQAAEEERQTERRARALRAVSAGLQGVGSATQRPIVSCQSTAIGQFVTTQCH